MRTHTLVVYLFGFSICQAAHGNTADSSQNPYQQISHSNVFRLKVPEPEKRREEAPPLLPKITLVGITTILKEKRAFMRVTLPVRSIGPAQEYSIILAQGQREGLIEVLEIDEKAGRVTINNYGTVMVLTFENEGSSRSGGSIRGQG